MREDILKAINCIRMSENIKPNFSARTEKFHASRNIVKKYFYLKEGETPKKKKRVYSSMYNKYEDFVRKRVLTIPSCPYAALFMVLKDRPILRNSIATNTVHSRPSAEGRRDYTGES